MKVTLKNIGLVESAEINIGGLTVITGHNSVGKSFIGKAIYSAVKAVNGLKNINQKTVLEQINQLYKYLRDEIDRNWYIGKLSETKILEIHKLASNFPLYIFPFNSQENYRSVIDKIQIIENHFNKLTKGLEQIEPSILENESFQIIIDQFKQLKNTPLTVTSHNYLINNIFKKEYNNTLTKELSTLKIQDKTQAIINIKVEGNITSNFETKSDFFYADSTYIETPIILSLISYIRDNMAFEISSRTLLPQYIIDLVQKLVEGGYDTPTDNPLYNSIMKTISGQLAVDNNQVVYKDEAKNSYNINNVASGIKSFGIIQLLLAGGSINPNSILIIDEPEVHLHPEWQLEYAKLLVELVKNNIPVIVTSHSPYFVEALKVYSDKAKISDKTYFYLGEMGEKGSTFKDVSQNLDLLFEKFSAPMLKLILEK